MSSGLCVFFNVCVNVTCYIVILWAQKDKCTYMKHKKFTNKKMLATEIDKIHMSLFHHQIAAMHVAGGEVAESVWLKSPYEFMHGALHPYLGRFATNKHIVAWCLTFDV